ncbi:MAG: quinone-dependent dihydroorotate dehydrogenase [Bdellovibrionales bacterium]|nr:quinone-dependent dihydroorotate dehydrogenase [Bdellovibrionales bacterium]
MNFYPVLRELLFRIEPEQAHHFIFNTAKCFQAAVLPLPVIRSMYRFDSERLVSHRFGLRFPNPVGLAAGFDKNGEIVNFMASLGFGFLEIGSVTNLPSEGNPAPRLFRLPEDRALINRMGLNNKGPDAVLANLRRQRPSIPVGINIAKSNRPDVVGSDATADMVSCYRQVAAYGDYIVLNVSCPNTKDGKTFEDPEILQGLLRQVQKSRQEKELSAPLLVKFSSDLTLDVLEKALEVCEAENIDGYVMVNTSGSRAGLATRQSALDAIGAGGLSGKPLQAKALEKIAFAYRFLAGRKPIVGLGGVDSPEYAYKLIKAGASLVQFYTAMVYHGPALCQHINEGLDALLEREGFESIDQAIGVDSK